ncbi:hypothetical protein CPB86DRAFT_820105 [Serendipita vermifera]|nr:hypothetical protein CPB86DRAFT_820105 [Serendipita vermifera]
MYRFMYNYDLLRLTGKPKFTIAGVSFRYVKKITAQMQTGCSGTLPRPVHLMNTVQRLEMNKHRSVIYPLNPTISIKEDIIQHRGEFEHPMFKAEVGTLPSLLIPHEPASSLGQEVSKVDPDDLMLSFKDITVELATRDDCFLADIPYLVLELNQDGRVVDKANLLSRESSRGIWDADEPLVLREVIGVFMLSVSIQLDEDDRQLVGSIELGGTELYEIVGTHFEIPLVSHENYPTLILQTKIWTIEDVPEDIRELIAGTIQQISSSRKDGTLQNMFSEGLAAYHEFERCGSLEHLELAVSKFEAVANMTPEGDSNLPGRLSDLGGVLISRFEQLGRIADINKSIERLERAVGLTGDNDPDKPGRLSNLGTSLMRRFERCDQVGDIDSAIIHQQMAISLTPDQHPNKPLYLNNLGNSLQRRFEQFGAVGDLDSAIVHKQMAVSLTPDQHSHKPIYLNNLGVSLQTRFERFGAVGDIDSAIIHLQMAVRLTPDQHLDKPGRLENLGAFLRIRFERFNKIDDINTAIIHQQMAINLTPDEHPDKPSRLSNLGSSLVRQFERLGKVGDIDSAIIHQQMAVSLTPDEHPTKPMYSSNLGVSLMRRFERFGAVGDIDTAIIQKQLAVDLTPDEHPDKPSRLNNLGISLMRRFERFGAVDDINSAIIHLQMTISLTPDGHPDKPSRLGNLGTAFKERFLRFQHHEDAKAVIKYYSASAQSLTGSPISRFNSVKRWIDMASLTGHDSLLPAYECAVGLMPLVAWLGLSIADRHEHLVKIGSMAREAAAVAISLDQYDKAVEWLEQGRSIVWNQILQLRTPVDELRIVDPDLADRLMKVSQLLNQGMEQKGGMKFIEEEGQRYRALTTEWESIIEQVRALPNFQDFLKPPRISRLRDAAEHGPVVTFNIAEKRCDALALVPGFDEVIHIPLPNITWERATELRDKFKDMLYSSGIRMRGERAAKQVDDEEEFGDCKPILVELWSGLVKPALDSLAFSPQPDVLPRIWWCATGPLAFLPIHAAGIYDDESTGSHVSDYVISSYTPTLSSLLQSIYPAPDMPFKLLSVIQPSAPGVSSILNTREELECIQRRVGSREHIVLNDREGTKERVKKAMKNSNWVHLACHGSQRQDEPTKSGLILEDGHLTLEEIIKLELPNAEFAFLSACQTTTGDEELSDEAVHIAGGMLLAGYRGVVATMWSIQDDLAPEVADEFYRHIMEDEGRPDSRKAAEALHYSIQKLRKRRSIPLTSWIPFVHLGM